MLLLFATGNRTQADEVNTSQFQNLQDWQSNICNLCELSAGETPLDDLSGLTALHQFDPCNACHFGQTNEKLLASRVFREKVETELLTLGRQIASFSSTTPAALKHNARYRDVLLTFEQAQLALRRSESVTALRSIWRAEDLLIRLEAGIRNGYMVSQKNESAAFTLKIASVHTLTIQPPAADLHGYMHLPQSYAEIIVIESLNTFSPLQLGQADFRRGPPSIAAIFDSANSRRLWHDATQSPFCFLFLHSGWNAPVKVPECRFEAEQPYVITLFCGSGHSTT